jgi:hypothetical protein
VGEIPSGFTKPGKDTTPLIPIQLSDDEVRIILEIEMRLSEMRVAQLPADMSKDVLHYLAKADSRDSRVLLLDGGRGTGKTSLLLTLVDRWRLGQITDEQRKRIADAYKGRNSQLESIPNYLKVLPILDFDPLPPGVPLLAGIVQAWRPLAKDFDYLSGKLDDCDDSSETLMDLWHRLFQFAAVGWSNISGNKSLIEQILDRQEQVQDWQRFRDQWQNFVNKVFEVGTCIAGPHKLRANSVFVIMIDDVDLQVERIRELLPALRMLYHPRVAFIIAADRYHMTDMLEVDFRGQQRKIGYLQTQPLPEEVRISERWPRTLAKASFQKVFRPRNSWRLHWLTLRQLLDFPPDHNVHIKDVLNQWESQSSGKLGDYLYGTGISNQQTVDISLGESDLPRIMSYRMAQQIGEQEWDPNNISKDSAVDLVCQLLEDDEFASARRTPAKELEYSATGVLGALFHRGYEVDLRSAGEIVLSSRANFTYRDRPTDELIWMTDNEESASRIWRLLIAASLQDDKFGVAVSGLAWEVRLALAWTTMRPSKGQYRNSNIVFWWRIHELPSPITFLKWAREWETEFVRKLSENTLFRVERIVYAWIYYQLRWMSEDVSALSQKGVPEPFAEKFNESWDVLLSFEVDHWKDQDKKRWRNDILPLMARPELGLPHAINNRLLKYVDGAEDISALKTQRRRLITDAIIAGAHQERRPEPNNAEDQELVDGLADQYEELYRKAEGIESSAWCEKIERQPSDAL